jgi:hypothetical protein
MHITSTTVSILSATRSVRRVQQMPTPRLRHLPMLEKHDALEKLKQALLIHKAGMQDSYQDIDPGGIEMPELRKAMVLVFELISQLYEGVANLQWAIGEHDANYSEHQEGFVASNVGELEAMLNRISSLA